MADLVEGFIKQSVCLPASMFRVMSSTNSINWVSHDRPFRNPCERENFWSHQLQTNLAHMYFMQADGTHHYQPYNETCWNTQYTLFATAWNLEALYKKEISWGLGLTLGVLPIPPVSYLMTLLQKRQTGFGLRGRSWSTRRSFHGCRSGLIYEHTIYSIRYSMELGSAYHVKPN
jgi:hypothetical protein